MLYCTFAVEAESPASREKSSGTLSFLAILSAGAAGDTDAFYNNERRSHYMTYYIDDLTVTNYSIMQIHNIPLQEQLRRGQQEPGQQELLRTL